MILSAESIEAEYKRLGHQLGWRFLTCPAKNIENASVAMVTINPGGRNFEKPMWSVENGSAYVDESWKGFSQGNERLQRQVQKMFETVNVIPQEVLSGYLVPFRSRDWASLQNKRASLKFGIGLWREIFCKAQKIETVITFGKQMARPMREVLVATYQTSFCAGWGDQKIDVYSFNGQCRLIVIPHLSRYALFDRSEKVAETALVEALKR